MAISPSWLRRICSPTTRCSSTPAGSTARWNSMPRIGWPSPARVLPRSRWRLSAPGKYRHEDFRMDNSSSLLRQRLGGWFRQLKQILLALGFVLIVRTVAAEPYWVPSPSMVPTLLTGDQLVASKYAYGYSRYSSPIGLMPDFSGRLLGKTPERGDVIVFRLPRDPSTTYVKRLICLPGARIPMQGG